MTKVETATAYAEKIAKDNSHGYSQSNRWGNPDFDCSGLVITAFEKAGIKLKSNGATYTGNMAKACEKCGMKNVTSSVNLKTGKGLVRGDILLTPNKHTAIYTGNNKMVAAHINEKCATTGGKSGDQTGNEISITTYKNYPWSLVYRYSTSASSKKNIEQIAKEVIGGKWGNGEERKKKLKAAGYNPSQVQYIVNKLLQK